MQGHYCISKLMYKNSSYLNHRLLQEKELNHIWNSLLFCMGYFGEFSALWYIFNVHNCMFDWLLKCYWNVDYLLLCNLEDPVTVRKNVCTSIPPLDNLGKIGSQSSTNTRFCASSLWAQLNSTLINSLLFGWVRV